MMRAWGSRPDTFVTDEPLYAHYLRETRASHPGADEIIARGETDWRKVAAYLNGPIVADPWYGRYQVNTLFLGVATDATDKHAVTEYKYPPRKPAKPPNAVSMYA